MSTGQNKRRRDLWVRNFIFPYFDPLALSKYPIISFHIARSSGIIVIVILSHPPYGQYYWWVDEILQPNTPSIGCPFSFCVVLAPPPPYQQGSYEFISSQGSSSFLPHSAIQCPSLTFIVILLHKGELLLHVSVRVVSLSAMSFLLIFQHDHIFYFQQEMI